MTLYDVYLIIRLSIENKRIIINMWKVLELKKQFFDRIISIGIDFYIDYAISAWLSCDKMLLDVFRDKKNIYLKYKKNVFLDFRKILLKQQINSSKNLAYQSRLILHHAHTQ